MKVSLLVSLLITLIVNSCAYQKNDNLPSVKNNPVYDSLRDAKWAFYSFTHMLSASRIDDSGKKINVPPVSCNLLFNRKVTAKNGAINFVFSVISASPDSAVFDITPIGITGVTEITKGVYIPLYHMLEPGINVNTEKARKDMQYSDSIFCIYIKNTKNKLNDFLIKMAFDRGLIK
jgi:hypothetical protein